MHGLPGAQHWYLPKVHQELKTTLHRELLNRVDLEKLTSLEDVKARGAGAGHNTRVNWDTGYTAEHRRKRKLSREVLARGIWSGAAGAAAAGPTINDILVNTQAVYVERAGVLEKTKVVFKDKAH